MFKAGFLFKETHDEIHFVRQGHGKSGDCYSANFDRDGSLAKVFEAEADAKQTIMRLMESFVRDTDYRWTPVIINESNGNMLKIIDSRWH